MPPDPYGVPIRLEIGRVRQRRSRCALLVTCNYFDVLQLRPAIGTDLTRANCDTPNASPTVVLSHALWMRTFAADPEIIRQTITLNGQPVVVVGVGPAGFEGIDLTKAAFFASTSLQRGFNEDPHLSWLSLLGRRERGADLSQVRAELAVIAGAPAGFRWRLRRGVLLVNRRRREVGIRLTLGAMLATCNT